VKNDQHQERTINNTLHNPRQHTRIILSPKKANKKGFSYS